MAGNRKNNSEDEEIRRAKRNVAIGFAAALLIIALLAVVFVVELGLLSMS